MDKLSIETRNVDGLRDNLKRAKNFLLLNQSNSDIFLLQETHSTPLDEIAWSREWGGEIKFSHGTSKSRGVAILIKKMVTPSIQVRD